MAARDHYAKLKRLEELKKNYALFFYQPYPKQLDFHAAGAAFRERLFMAGNQLGKCVVIGSYINTPTGPVEVQKLKEGDEVWAWGGSERVAATVHAPFQKLGLHACYRLLMSDGQWVDCADHHRLLTSSGWRFVESLLPSGLSQQQSNLEPALPVRVSSVLRWTKKAANFVDRCYRGFRQHGAQLLRGARIPQSRLPSPACALQHNPPLSRADVPDNTYTSSVQADSVLLSSLGVLRRTLGRFVAFAVLSAYKPSTQNLPTHLAAQLLSTAASLLLRLAGGFGFPNQDVSELQNGPWQVPDVDGNSIIAIIPIGRHKVYDFTVPNYHNYCAAGLVHHNTLCAGNEVAFHVTGIYPDWWKGKHFVSATRGWVAGLTSEMTRDGAQRILMGPVGKWGTGAIPKELIVEIKRARGVPDAIETVLIKHEPSGEISQITFKAQADGREAFQSETLDWLWFDEEPGLDIYSEALTRTNATTGPVFLTFTPLLGMSNVVMRFLGPEQSKDRKVVNMTIDDVAHYTEEQKRKIIEQYPLHEREARTLGIPMLGSGRIYPIAEQVLREEPLGEIPKNWKQIIGMDFGWDHPTAAVKLAYDETNDCIHVVSAYKQTEATPLIHAAAIKVWGSTIPVAWPHDALQHDKRGDQFYTLYRDQGLEMISEHAQFANEKGNSVEAGILEILQRMQTGRFKVDRSLSSWWEEFRMYHRKKNPDGTSKINKTHDDLLDATRYAVMMLRYALSSEEIIPHRDRYKNRSNYSEASWMSA